MGVKILNNTAGAAIPNRRPGGAVINAYEVPAGSTTVVSSVVICNTDATYDDDFVLYACKASEAPSSNNTIAKGKIPAGESYVMVVGISLDEGESIRCADVNSRCAVTVFGNES